MSETASRMLRLLSLLQARRDWPGPELADRLEVTTRTIRNDVERLRALGYPVASTRGAAGGYRLGAGGALPPLLLDDDEAVAVTVGLRTAAHGAVTGIDDTALRALAKIEQVLPSRLRHRVEALAATTVPIDPGGPTVDASVLAALARVCRDRERLRFDYRDHDGGESVRLVEPYRLVHARRRWYLVAWDVDRQDWRTFRADRVRPRPTTGPRFAPRPPPGGDLVAYVTEGLATAVWRFRARVTLHAPADVVAGRLPPGAGVVVPLDAHTCAYEGGADTPAMLAHHLGLLDVDFEVHEPPELIAHVRRLAGRYAAATPSTGP